MAPTSHFRFVLLYLLASNILLIAKLASTKVNIEKEIYEKTQLVGEAFTAGDLYEATYITTEIVRLTIFFIIGIAVPGTISSINGDSNKCRIWLSVDDR